MINSKDVVITAFNQKERFNIDSIPKHFESVTRESINRLKTSCLKRVEKEFKGQFPAGSLQAILQSINGQFETTYATLEGDYGTRIANLKGAYREGVAELIQTFKDFQLQVDAHEKAFNRFSDISKKISGQELSNDLKFPTSETNRMKQEIDSLKERD